VWDLCGVRYIVRPSALAYAHGTAYNDGRFCVFENKDCLPFIYAMHDFAQVKGMDGVISLLQSPGFDSRSKLVISDWDPLEIEIPSLEMRKCQSPVTNVERKADRICFEVEMKCAGFAVVNDAFYPGWKAYVDGKPQEIIKANGIFRSVYLTKGAHRVEMVFRPVLYYVSALVTGAGLLITAVILLSVRRVRRAGLQ